MEKIFFAHPIALFNQIDKLLQKVGPEKFFRSSDEEVKKAREGFAAYFFTLAMKKYTGRDWWLAQYDQATRNYPDFDFISFAEDPNDIKIEKVELTGFYPHFKSFDEALEVVNKKIKKYRNKPIDFSLLIFANHGKSEEWINLLRKKINTEYPFLSIWTIHLLFKNNVTEVKKAIAQRIVPLPGLKIEADMDDSEIHKPQSIPSYMEEQKENGKTYILFKSEFIDKINKIKK
jgi:hypothetical protein